MYPKTAKMIDRLADRTSEGKVNWEQTADERIFQVAFPNYSVTISSERTSNDPEPEYVVSILNDSGLLVEQVTADDLEEYVSETYSHSIERSGAYANKLLEKLYENARGHAMGVGRAVDQILGELGEDDSSDIPF